MRLPSCTWDAVLRQVIVRQERLHRWSLRGGWQVVAGADKGTTAKPGDSAAGLAVQWAVHGTTEGTESSSNDATSNGVPTANNQQAPESDQP